MDGDALYSIGELARRTGLTVKAIRFYSDRGIVPPTGRSPAGYRLYGVDAVARLDLVRTLREMGLDLPTIRKVADRQVSLAEVAAAHVEALAVQIRLLRLRQAVLTAVARRGSTPEEVALMHKLAKLSEDERQRLVGEFLDAVFGGLDATAEFVGIRRSMTPELPDGPEAEQVEAWVELAGLSQDPDFRASVRCMVEQYAPTAPWATPPRACAATLPRGSVTWPPRPSRRASTRPRRRPSRSSRRSWPGTRTSCAAPTTSTFVAACWPYWRPRTTHAGSSTFGCFPWSTAGPPRKVWRRCSTGSSRRSVSGRLLDADP